LTFPTRILAVVIVVGVVSVAAYVILVSSTPPGSVTTNVPSTFSVNGKTFRFNYIAITQSEREQGLMNRKITNQTTMLFAFPSASEWSFWMLDTNTSLDMIWVNADGSTGSVVYIQSAAPPCMNDGGCPVYTPTSSANFVIEAKAGFAAVNGISVGTNISFT